jgi:hypothetical protein
MQELLTNPYFSVACLVALIPITGIVFGTVTHAWQRVRRAEIEAALKHEMIERGMSADEIRQILEASAKGGSKHRKHCRDSSNRIHGPSSVEAHP